MTKDRRNSDERVEDLAFENRIKTLTRERKWQELRAVLVIYGSALDDREHHEVVVGEVVGGDADEPLG